MIDSQKMKTSYKQLTENFRVILLALLLAAGISYVYAWTGPTQAPPNGNVSAPINVGVIDQIKDAGLGVNVLAVFGQGSFGGEVIIGSTGASCDADLEGAIKYNTSSKKPEYCDGAAWTELGGAITDNGLPFYGTTHTKEQCQSAGGTVVDYQTNSLCKFQNASCSSDWTRFQNLGATSNITCGYNPYSYVSCPFQPCTTGSHSFGNFVSETCSYRNANANYDVEYGYTCDLTNYLTCTATTIEVGCY